MHNAIRVESPDFPNLGEIPRRHATNGDNVPPRLKITGWPAETRELAVIVHDPDAPLPHGFTHWCVYGIEPDGEEVTVDGGDGELMQGPNGLGESAYAGPEPPIGHGIHHYYFWVYALDRPVVEPLDREEFLAEYGDSIITQCRVVGTYRRD